MSDSDILKLVVLVGSLLVFMGVFEIKNLNRDIRRLEKKINRLENELIDLRYKKKT